MVRKRRVRLCVFAVLGLIGILFGTVVRNRIATWGEVHAEMWGGASVPVFVILREMWDEPFDQDDYGVYIGYEESVRLGKPFVARAWLGQRATRPEVEELLKEVAEHWGKSDQGRQLEERIRRVLELERPGDTYRHFRTPPYTWRQLTGREGITLVRDGVPIAGIVTVLN